MKKILSILFFLILSLSLFSQTELKTTSVNVNFRYSPNDTSKILLIIPKGTVLQIDEDNQDYSEWNKVNYKNETGYVYQKYLQNPPSNVKYYTNSQGHKVQSPTYYDNPPAGASAQCYDGSYSFSQSRRGTCSHHGGVKRWL